MRRYSRNANFAKSLDKGGRKCYNTGMEKRIVAFDIGNKRIGVAWSDPFNSYAIPSQTYFRTGKFAGDVEAIAKIAEEGDAGKIVCGLPLFADGTKSEQTEITLRFVAALRERIKIPVVTEDERYTTLEAHADQMRTGVREKKRKESVDSLAAAYILERYLFEHQKRSVYHMSMKEDRENYEEEDNIVELVDEEGNTLKYEHVGTVQYEGEWYCCFVPADEAQEASEEDEDEGEEVEIFHLVGGEDDEQLEVIEDEDLLEKVFAEFYRQYEEENGDEE